MMHCLVYFGFAEGFICVNISYYEYEYYEIALFPITYNNAALSV